MTAMAEFSSLHFLNPLERMTGLLLSTSIKQTARFLQSAESRWILILPQKEEGEMLLKHFSLKPPFRFPKRRS
jgi:hypothetical protein